MKTIKISPLGACLMAFWIGQWNQSRDVEFKMHIRTLLQSGNAAKVQKALWYVAKLTHNDMMLNESMPDNIDSFLLTMGRLVHGDNSQEKDDKAKSELAFYLDQAFNAGHLDQLPLEFGYETLPPQIQCHVSEDTNKTNKLAYEIANQK